MRDLDKYPYGCSEQTVSRALPLLYLSDLGVDPKDSDAEIPNRMQKAVTRLVNRQSGSGSFGLWSAYGDDSNLRLTAYVTDFLLRAREKGFAVPEDVLVGGLDYIRNMVGNDWTRIIAVRQENADKAAEALDLTRRAASISPICASTVAWSQ